GDAVDRRDELAPGAALRFEHAGAGGRQPVVAPAALPRLLDPAALNPAAFLEAIEQRVERRDAGLEHAARAELDELAEVVAMARLVLDERQDQQFGAALLQFPVEHPRSHVLHSDILTKGIRRKQAGKSCRLLKAQSSKLRATLPRTAHNSLLKTHY